VSTKDHALVAIGRLTATQASAMRSASAALRRQRVGEVGAEARILVVRLDETIGDTVMFSPFLRELRRARPLADITLVVNRARADMYVACPYYERLITTDLGTAADARIIRRPWDARQLVAAELSGGFDLALVPRVDYDHHAAFIAASSGAGRRAGFSERSTARKRVVNRGVDRLFTDVVVAAPHRHEIDRQLDLLRAVGLHPVDAAPEVWLDDGARHAAEAMMFEAGVSGAFVVLAPSGGHSDLKRWPLERFADLAMILDAAGLQPVFIGGPGDRGLLELLPDDVRAVSADLIGRLSPLGSAAVLERSSGFVGADSGLTHVAAALGRPTVAVFGPTCTHAFAPRGPSVTVISRDLPCGPCTRGAAVDRCDTCIFPTPLCMDSVGADEAWVALSDLMATSSRGQVT
jgi:ADP-heptose:LPS heptosyltransferase